MLSANLDCGEEPILLLGDARTFRLPCSVDAIITDPPYGIGYKVNKRSFSTRGEKLTSTKWTVTEAVGCIAGDEEKFDPSPWLAISPLCAFFGAQHFADRLPIGRWLVWDKRRESKPDAHSDADLIWMSGDHREALRVHRQKWRGIVREGEENASRSRKLHPNHQPFHELINFSLDVGEFDAAIYDGFSDGLKATIAKSPEFKLATGQLRHEDVGRQRETFSADLDDEIPF